MKRALARNVYVFRGLGLMVAILPMILWGVLPPAATKVELRKISPLIPSPLWPTPEAVLPVSLPLTVKTEGEPAVYQLSFEMGRNFYTPDRYRFMPDDCVDWIRVNGREVSLADLSPSQRCDYRNGFVFPLGKELSPGSNTVEIGLRNIQGWYGFDLKRDVKTAWTALLGTLSFLGWLIFFGGVAFFNPQTKSQQWVEIFLFSAGAALRTLFIFILEQPQEAIYSDVEAYIQTAQAWVTGVFEPYQSFKPVGYSMILAFFFKLSHGSFLPMIILQLLSSIAVMILCWRIGAFLLGRQTAIFVLLLAVFQWQWIRFTCVFLPETIFTLFLGVSMWLLLKKPDLERWTSWRGVGLGMFLASGIALKGTYIFFFPLWFLSPFPSAYSEGLQGLRRKLRRSFPAMVSICLGAGVVIALLGIFNQKKLHAQGFAATSAGLNFVEGKCPWKINTDTSGRSWISPLFLHLGETDSKVWPRNFYDSAYFWGEGWKCVENDPWVLLRSVRYLYYLFNDNPIWPGGGSRFFDAIDRAYEQFYSWVIFPGVVFVLVQTFLPAIRKDRRTRGTSILVLMVFALFLNVWLFKSELRYRVPFDVILIPLAVLGWVQGLKKQRSQRQATT